MENGCKLGRMPDAHPDFTWHHEFRPGDLGRIVSAHGEVYGREFGWPGAGFEAAVAEGLGTFARAYPARAATDGDRVWIAERAGTYAGSVAVQDVVPGRSAQLRWLIVAPAARGQGLGERLTTAVVARCRERGLATVRLFTTPGQGAAIALYRKLGFRKLGEEPHDRWGFATVLEWYELTL